MHHFHLGSEMEVDGFVKRSDHLIFAIVGSQDAYFVDVRPHPPPRSVEWARQELLRIAYLNWPQLIEGSVLHGVLPATVADAEIHQLRQNNLNAIIDIDIDIDIDGKAIAPLLGGMLGDGSSLLCTLRASKLLGDLRHHEQLLANDDIRQAVVRNLRAQGLDPGPMPGFELVFLESLSPFSELIAALTADGCVSRNLCRTGFAVIERRTRSPIVLHARASA